MRRLNMLLSFGLGILLLSAFFCAGCVEKASDKPAATQQEQTSTTAGAETLDASSPFMITRTEGLLAVVEYVGNSVAFIDPATGAVVGRANIGANPAAVTVRKNANTLFVADSGGGELAVATFGTTDKADRFRIGTQPMALAIDESRGVIYAADYHLNSIRIVDMTLLSLVGNIPLEAQGFESREIPPACCYNALDGTVLEGRKPVSLALSPDGSTLYSGNIGTYDVSILDLDSKKETGQFDGVIGMRDVIVTPDGEYLLIAGVGSEEIVVDTLLVKAASDGSTLANIPVGKAVAGVAQSEDGSTVVAISRDDGTLVSVNPEDWTVEGTCTLSQGLSDVALSSDGAFAYACNSLDGSLYTVDMKTLQVVSKVEGLSDPRFICCL